MSLIPLDALPAQIDFDLHNILRIGVASFAVILTVISLFAYKRTGMRSLLLVSAAFLLFVVKTAVQVLNDFIPETIGSYVDLLMVLMDFVILLLFILAVTPIMRTARRRGERGAPLRPIEI